MVFTAMELAGAKDCRPEIAIREIPRLAEFIRKFLLRFCQNTWLKKGRTLNGVFKTEVIENIPQKLLPNCRLHSGEIGHRRPTWLECAVFWKSIVVNSQEGAFLQVRKNDPPATTEIVYGLIGKIFAKCLLILRPHGREGIRVG